MPLLPPVNENIHFHCILFSGACCCCCCCMCDMQNYFIKTIAKVSYTYMHVQTHEKRIWDFRNLFSKFKFSVLKIPKRLPLFRTSAYTVQRFFFVSVIFKFKIWVLTSAHVRLASSLTRLDECHAL